MVDTGAVRRKRKTIIELLGEISLSDVDYLTSDELGTEEKEDKESIEDDGGIEDDSEGETIGSEDWSLDESDDDSQERRDLEDFIVEDSWAKEESDGDYTESEEEDDNSDDSTIWGEAEIWSGGESSDGFQVHEHLENIAEEDEIEEY